MTILLACLLLVITPNAYAETLTNDNFSLETKDINLQNNASPTSPAASAAPSPANGEGPGEAFTFSLSTLLVDFGELSPTNPTTRTTTVTISPSSSFGFSLQLWEDQLLISPSNRVIPDTTCDNGLCNAKSSALWESLLTFGLGYRCDNIKQQTCVGNFQNQSFYQSLANKAKGDVPIVVMENSNNKEAQANITYKLNLSQTKDIETYKNTIKYIAVPNF